MSTVKVDKTFKTILNVASEATGLPEEKILEKALDSWIRGVFREAVEIPDEEGDPKVHLVSSDNEEHSYHVKAYVDRLPNFRKKSFFRIKKKIRVGQVWEHMRSGRRCEVVGYDATHAAMLNLETGFFTRVGFDHMDVNSPATAWRLVKSK